MVKSNDCLKHYGIPVADATWLTLWDVPTDLELGIIPRRIYCNTDLIRPLEKAFINLISRGYAESELKTWDGCFNIRKMRGNDAVWSLHSWGIAVDVNALTNPFRGKPTLSYGFVMCFVDAGFDWGGIWQVPDGQHFQLKELPAKK